jgi:hypothetical protein
MLENKKEKMTDHPQSPFLWKEDLRPSIFANDIKFRTKHHAGMIEDAEGLGYKQFGTYSKAETRQPNKHEGVLKHAKTKTSQ